MTVDRRTFLKGLGAGTVAVATARHGVWGRASAQETTSVRVYMIVVDGLRPDEVPLMQQLSELVAEGTYYPQARADMVAETTTNHVSMLTGMRPTRHGMPGNAVPTLPIRVSDNRRYLKADSLLTLMRRQAPDMRSAAIGAKTYVAELSKHDRTGDGEIDAHRTNTPVIVVPVVLDSAPDEEIGSEALAASRELDPDFLFVNLGDVDRVGHFDETGGITDGEAPVGRLTTLQRADAQLRRLVEELKSSDRWEQTVFIVTADHSMDWSRRDRGRNLAPLFEEDELLAGEVLAAINGGASLYALRSPAEPLAPQRLKRTREIALTVEGVDEALYIHPNPVDGGEAHWVGRVHPHWGLGGDFAGDLLVTMRSGYRLGHSTSTPDEFANPIPGNHGHTVTLPIPIVVAGGFAGVRAQAIDPGEVPPEVEHPTQARNIDLAPTTAWLLGLNPPPGGFDGRVLEEAFTSRPQPRTAVANVRSVPTTARVAGANRFATAAALSQLAFPDGAETAVVASGEDFADALAATPLAIQLQAPLLLAAREGSTPELVSELERLEPDQVVIVGGLNALSDAVEADMERAGLDVATARRIAGIDRFDTARLIALEVSLPETNRQVYLAVGAREGGPAFPDALAAGPVAGARPPEAYGAGDGPQLPNQGDFTAGEGFGPRPVLLTVPEGLPPATAAALEALDPDRVVLVGGPRAVGSAVERQLRRDGLVVERLGGPERYETARLIAERGIREGTFTDRLFLASGANFPDALAAGAAVGRIGGTLMLVPPGGLGQGATRRFLLDRGDEFVHVHVIGGSQALPDALVSEVSQLLVAHRTRL